MNDSDLRAKSVVTVIGNLRESRNIKNRMWEICQVNSSSILSWKNLNWFDYHGGSCLVCVTCEKGQFNLFIIQIWFLFKRYTIDREFQFSDCGISFSESLTFWLISLLFVLFICYRCPPPKFEWRRSDEHWQKVMKWIERVSSFVIETFNFLEQKKFI